MALVFSSLTNSNDVNVKIDIIFVPAIGADPQETWARQVSEFESDRLDIALRDRLKGSVQTHLYDHLTPHERSLRKRPTDDVAHQDSVNAFAAAEDAIAEFGVVEWADRLLQVVRQHRRSRRTEHRPIIAICHSTGGTIVKQALSKRAEERKSSIYGLCLGVIFFATPHHGSSVLSEDTYVQAVKDSIGLKWEMSDLLRQEFALNNTDLETLNYTFAKAVVGTKIHNYVESVDTDLRVLSSSDSAGETPIEVRLCITDSRSGKLGTPEVPVDDEDTVQLSATHVGTPRFTGEDRLYSIFKDEMCKLVGSYSEEHRRAYQELNKSIMQGVEVDVHQFYGETKAVKILSTHPCLEEFLEFGPNHFMNERIQGSDRKDKTPTNRETPPAFHIRNASDPKPPVLTFTTAAADEDSAGLNADSTPALSAPVVPPPKNIHTRRPSLKTQTSAPPPQSPGSSRRPSLTTHQSEPHSPGHLAPKDAKQVQFRIAPQNEIEPNPRRTPALKLPNRETFRFKWIHVPFNHSHWVSQVLTTISQEKQDPRLHSHLLLDKIWFLQHNRSRHATPHARFVRPSVKCLLPESADNYHIDGITTPSSAGDEIQFVVYMPYLHWDSFAAMKKRASVINRRRLQADARPIVADIARSKSLEHKIIWQYLKSDRPVHCRRTLDQYRYPSLRNTEVRDSDQILYKRTKPDADAPPSKDAGKISRPQGFKSTNKGPGTDDGAAKVLMVDQLWLWIIDDQTVVTFFTPKEREDDDNGLSRDGDLRSQIYQDINGDYASNQCHDPFDFAALAVAHAIKAILDNAAHEKLQVFSIFEEYISLLTERQTMSFKKFRNSQRLEKMEDIQAQRKADNRDNREDLDALLELRDIEDELKTIDKLIHEQTICVDEMKNQYHHLNHRHSKGLNGIKFLHDVASFLAEHKEQVDSMLESAKAAQQAYKDLLDMKQKQANIREAQLAYGQTLVTADQSRSVMVFTVFTIIFLPLSFFASVFGMNTQEWNGPNTGFLPLPHILTYMGAISLAVIVVALLVAFNRYTRRLARKVWRGTGGPVLDLLGIKYGRPSADNVADGRDFNTLDVEKANLVDAEAARKRLSTISRTDSMARWGDDLWSKQLNGSAH